MRSGMGLPRKLLRALASHCEIEDISTSRRSEKGGYSEAERCYSSGVPLSCPVVVALGEPGRALAALASSSGSVSGGRPVTYTAVFFDFGGAAAVPLLLALLLLASEVPEAAFLPRLDEGPCICGSLPRVLDV